ncbi:MAG: hypothetical protein K2Q14_04820 [Gammaproteobacteria bacterium]|nr:hypothetical protein [Gammaproteobacteria bacterium]
MKNKTTWQLLRDKFNRWYLLSIVSGILTVAICGYIAYATYNKVDEKIAEIPAEMAKENLEKKLALQDKLNAALNQFQKTNAQIRLDCQRNLNQDENRFSAQQATRYDARQDVIQAGAGISVIFGDAAFQAEQALLVQDAIISDICNTNMTSYKRKWDAGVRKLNSDLNDSIESDKEIIAQHDNQN